MMSKTILVLGMLAAVQLASAQPKKHQGTLTAQPDANQRCFECMDRRNQKDLYSDPTDCHFYFQCFYVNETTAIGFRRACPQGEIFNEYVLTCVAEGPTPCSDQCSNPTIATTGCYGVPNNCATYFVCSNGISYPFCCPAGTAINTANCMCEASETCTDVCTLPAPIPTTVAPPTANATHCTDSFGNVLQAVAGNPGQFISYGQPDEENGNQQQFVSNCAPGTTFELSTCACTGLVELTNAPSGRQCLAYFPFDTDFTDASVNHNFADVIGNAIVSTTAAARGAGSLYVNNGRIEIPATKGIDLDHQASWCLFFRCESGMASDPYACLQSGGLLSNNGGHNNDYSFIMSANSNPATRSRVDAQMRLVNPGETVNLSYPTTAANGFNQACVTYDGTTARLYINGELVQPCTDCVRTTSGGAVAITQCPYTIGTDQILGNFTGYIDEVLICPVTLTPAEVNAHFRGDTNFLATEGLLPSHGGQQQTTTAALPQSGGRQGGKGGQNGPQANPKGPKSGQMFRL